MSKLFQQLTRCILTAGTAVAKTCATAVKLGVKPLSALVLRAMHKGNRVASRAVHCARRFSYIARHYGVKRAVGLTAYRFAQMGQRHVPAMKKHLLRFAPMALAAVVLVVAIQYWTDFTLAYEVNYNGNSIGYVSNESVVADACQMVSDQVVENEFNAGKVTYSLKVVSANALNSADEVCQNIIEVEQDIQMGVGLYVDGSLLAVCRDGDVIKNAMDAVIADYAKVKGEDMLSFANAIEYIGGLYPANMVKDTVAKEEIADVLTVMATRRETYTETIPFETVEIKSDSYYIGYRGVQTEGKNGTKQVVADVAYVGGNEVDRVVLSETVLTEAVDKVVVVGTKRYSSATANDDGQHLFWPVDGADVSDISSYFGDGRNHKGTDILAPNGTAIFACEDGVVTYVGWESGWGLYMVIDHGNGLSTLYSHCSSITAVQGQQVSRGEYIAAVGITGRAYGYHLHLEVQINGQAVDARPYLGIN